MVSDVLTENNQLIHFITYSNATFEKSKKRLCKEVENCKWFDSISSYSPTDLDTTFREKNKHVLNQSRIGGYGIWRPYIIKKKLSEINQGDILIYLDAGCTINTLGKKRFDEYIKMVNTCDNLLPIISFQLAHAEKHWTTKQIFDYFCINLDSEIANSGQILDGIIIMKKTPELIKIIDDWYKVINDDVLLFSDYYNNKNQEKYFIDNRHEQSIFSIIRKLKETIVLKDETYFKPFNKTNKEAIKYPFWATRIK